MLHWARRAPARPALIARDETWTYAALADGLHAARLWLGQHGVGPGDRVMIVAENGLPAIALLFGASAAGAWPVLVNAALAPDEVAAIRAHCQPRLLLLSGGPLVRPLAAACGATPCAIDGVGTVFATAPDPSAQAEPPDPSPARRLGALLYTSGSTGQPKGVMLSHRGMLFVAHAAAQIRAVTAADRFYLVMPVVHSVGLVSVLLCALLRGAAVEIATRYNPAEMLAAVRDRGITILLGTPALFALAGTYAGDRGLTRIDAPGLRLISASGSPLDPAVKQATETLFGLPLHHGYGITECSPTIAQTRPNPPHPALPQPNLPQPDLSVGPALPGVELRLGEAGDDSTGRPLFVRGPNVMLGYYRDPAATQAAIDPDGWFATGDLARLEGDQLFIVGRAKELIIRGGFNILPAEVEAALHAHPDVAQAAVIGMRAPSGEEEIVAFAQLRPGATTDQTTLLRHTATRLAAYKRPSRLVLMPQLPQLASGKIDKKALAKEV